MKNYEAIMSYDYVFILDIDECKRGQDAQCSNYATCVDNNGSFACVCEHGYKGDGFTCCKFLNTSFIFKY